MPRIGNAPNGANSSLDGTEKVPISNSQYTLISTIKTYLQSFFALLTGNNNFTGANSFTTNVSNASGIYVETHGSGHYGVDVELFTDSDNVTSPGYYLFRESDGDGNFSGYAFEAEQYKYGSGSFTGDWINFHDSDGEKFSIDVAGSPNIPTGQTYNINNVPHTHGITPLFDHYTDVGNVGTGEDDLYSDTIAAGQLASNGDKLQAEYAGLFVSSATATREIKIKFAGSTIFDSGALTLSLSSAWELYIMIIRVSASVVRYSITMTTEGAALAAYTATGELTGLTLSNTNILKITGESAGVGAATNDIVAKLGTVIYIKAA